MKKLNRNVNPFKAASRNINYTIFEKPELIDIPF